MTVNHKQHAVAVSYIYLNTFSILKKDIHETTEYLELFLRNLLLGEENALRNRDLHINAPKCNENMKNCTLDEIAVLNLLKTDGKRFEYWKVNI